MSAIYRLLFCFLLSAGVHGGLVFYDGVTSPAKSRLSQAPVVVSLLPAIDVPAPLPVIVPQPLPETVPAATQSHPVEETKKTEVLSAIPPPFPAAMSDAEKEQAVVTEEICATSQADRTDDALSSPEAYQSEIDPARVVMLAEDSSVAATQILSEATPDYRNNPLPEYPYLARKKHWEGVVWLLVDVSAQGLVNDLRVERSCGHKVLDREARQTVKRWQFSPARRAGLPVESQVRIPVRFRLEDS